jgi:lipid-binding SYLF domain-containing protein
MKRLSLLFGISLLVWARPTGLLQAASSEVATVESATEVLQALAGDPIKSIPTALLQNAKGVAIIPNVFKAGFVLGGRFGHGVILVRQPDGSWSNPVFITLAGGGIGWQIGVQSTDLVLVFKTTNSLAQILQGRSKVTLGADVAVAAGPVGRQAEAGTDIQLKAEIYSYSRSRGLFAGLSVEGAGILIDFSALDAFYSFRHGHPAWVLEGRGVLVPAAAEALKCQLTRLTLPLGAPPVIYPPQMMPPPVPTVPPPAQRPPQPW